MAIFRRIIAATIAAGALTIAVGAATAEAAPVITKQITVQPMGGGQGGWPI